MVAKIACIARTRGNAHLGAAMTEGILRGRAESARFVAMDKTRLAHDLVGA